MDRVLPVGRDIRRLIIAKYTRRLDCWLFLRALGLNGRSRASWLMTQAAAHGYVAILEWLENNGYPFSGRDACIVAAMHGHQAVLEWIHAKYRKANYWNSELCDIAARTGNLGLLKWLYENICPPTPATVEAAARHGHLHVMQWLRDAGYLVNTWEIIDLLAEKGHDGILRWMSGHIRPLNVDVTTCVRATLGNSLDVLKLLYELKYWRADWDAEIARIARENDHTHIVAWLAEVQRPRPD